MVLTEHFHLEEFTRSSTAQRMGIDNTIPKEYIPNIRNLCKQVLEPLREYVKEPVIISSGYRCPQLNKAVGGVGNSQHLTGEACDIGPLFISTEGERKEVLRKWFIWMMNNLNFDCLILERASKTSNHYWIHVSCRLDAGKNRQRVLQITKS